MPGGSTAKGERTRWGGGAGPGAAAAQGCTTRRRDTRCQGGRGSAVAEKTEGAQVPTHPPTNPWTHPPVTMRPPMMSHLTAFSTPVFLVMCCSQRRQQQGEGTRQFCCLLNLRLILPEVRPSGDGASPASQTDMRGIPTQEPVGHPASPQQTRPLSSPLVGSAAATAGAGVGASTRCMRACRVQGLARGKSQHAIFPVTARPARARRGAFVTAAAARRPPPEPAQPGPPTVPSMSSTTAAM